MWKTLRGALGTHSITGRAKSCWGKTTHRQVPRDGEGEVLLGRTECPLLLMSFPIIAHYGVLCDRKRWRGNGIGIGKRERKGKREKREPEGGVNTAAHSVGCNPSGTIVTEPV